MPSHDWILFAALSQEYSIARRLLRDVREETGPRLHVEGTFGGSRVVLVRTGMGPSAAEQSARWALSHFQPRRALMYGFAGGLSPAHGPGTLVWPTLVRSSTGEAIETDDLELATGTGVSGTLVTVNAVVATPRDKAALGERFGAIAVDMESFTVARACQEASVPFHVARAISDTVETVIPAEFENVHHPDGRLHLRNALWILARHPSLVPRAFELQRGSKAAARALRAVLLQLRKQFQDRP